jgi:hypothetical protein
MAEIREKNSMKIDLRAIAKFSLDISELFFT